VAATLEGQSRALTRLLNLMCDIVVELDRDLCLVEDSQHLSAFLTLGGRTTSLKGSKLQEFMAAEEDKQHFEQRLLGPMESESVSEAHSELLPGALPVKMRDSMGNILNMELFYTPCDILGQRRFFLGLREQADEPISQLPNFVRRQRRRSRSRRAVRAAGLARDSSAEQSSSVESSQSEQDLESEGSETGDSDVLQRVQLLDPRWQPVGEKGRILALLRALQKCNVRVKPTRCCPWHAAVASMKEVLSKFAGYQCVNDFTVAGNWQCACCFSVEHSQQDGETSPVTAPEVCSLCNTKSSHRRVAL